MMLPFGVYTITVSEEHKGYEAAEHAARAITSPERAYLEERTKERVCHNYIRGRHEEYYY